MRLGSNRSAAWIFFGLASWAGGGLIAPALAAKAPAKSSAASKKGGAPVAKPLPDSETASAEAPAEPKTKPKPVAKEADKDQLPRNLQRTILQRIKGKKPEGRVEAVQELAEYPTVDAAKLLVQHGLASKFEEVRRASYETLQGFKNNQEVCDFLMEAIKKDVNKGTARETTCALLGVVLASDLEPIESQTNEVLEKAAKQPKGGLLMLVTLVDELGRQGDETSLATLLKLSKLPLFESEFALRRSIVQALTNVPEPAAVDALIEILGNLKGEVRGDIARYLTSISGEEFELDANAWAEWWKANREDFDFPPRGQRAALARLKPKGTSLYYGMPIYAQRLVFVIDTSGSMRGRRIEAAKRELVNAINALPEGVYFNVLPFNVRVGSWQRKLVVASPENKQKAAGFVLQQDLGPATASYDALEAALEFDAESIYFLTDGAPHGGKVNQPAEIVDVLTRLNHTRRVTINSIGIDVGPAGNLFDTFLKTLAEQNYGEYRRVDE